MYEFYPLPSHFRTLNSPICCNSPVLELPSSHLPPRTEVANSVPPFRSLSTPWSLWSPPHSCWCGHAGANYWLRTLTKDRNYYFPVPTIGCALLQKTGFNFFRCQLLVALLQILVNIIFPVENSSTKNVCLFKVQTCILRYWVMRWILFWEAYKIKTIQHFCLLLWK